MTKIIFPKEFIEIMYQVKIVGLKDKAVNLFEPTEPFYGDGY